MVYSEGLGAINIARQAPIVSPFAGVKNPVQAVPVNTASPWPGVVPAAPKPTTTTTTKPVSGIIPETFGIKCPDGSISYSRTCPTAVVVKPSLPVIKPATAPPVFKPTVSAPKPSTTTVSVSGGASPTMPIEGQVSSGEDSKLPLILAGLAALFLLTRKKGRQ